MPTELFWDMMLRIFTHAEETNNIIVPLIGTGNYAEDLRGYGAV
jgi:hypothetical protein